MSPISSHSTMLTHNSLPYFAKQSSLSMNDGRRRVYALVPFFENEKYKHKVLSALISGVIPNAYTTSFRFIFLLESITLAKEIMERIE